MVALAQLGRLQQQGHSPPSLQSHRGGRLLLKHADKRRRLLPMARPGARAFSNGVVLCFEAKRHSTCGLSTSLTSRCFCCRLSGKQMLDTSDADLMEQCARILSNHADAAPRPVRTHALTVSQQSANSQRNAAAPLAVDEDDAATLPIGDDELSPRTRSFIGSKRKGGPASRELLEAWRAGQVDITPSKLTSGRQRNPTPSNSTLALSPSHALLGACTAVRAPQPCASAAACVAPPAVADTASAAEQPAATALLNGASTLHVATQTAPRPRSLLEALLIGR